MPGDPYVIDPSRLTPLTPARDVAGPVPIGKAPSAAVNPRPVAGAPAGADPKLWAAATEFEAVFVRQLIAVMRSEESEDDILGDSAGHSVYQGLFDSAIADSVASTGSLGIASAIYRQFSGSKGSP